MTGKEVNYIQETIANEGIDYGLNDYTDFEEVKDKRFHNLLQDYRESRKDLLAYVGLDEEGNKL